MADRLSVDLDGLEQLASDLDGIRARMNATRSLLDSYTGEIGSAKVEQALGSFEHNWKDGRKKIDGNAQKLAGMAREAAQGLRKVDGDLADKLTQADRPAPTGQPAG